MKEKLNEASWELHNELIKIAPISGKVFNNLKGCLKSAIEVYLDCKEKDDRGENK